MVVARVLDIHSWRCHLNRNVRSGNGSNKTCKIQQLERLLLHPWNVVPNVVDGACAEKDEACRRIQFLLQVKKHSRVRDDESGGIAGIPVTRLGGGMYDRVNRPSSEEATDRLLIQEI